MGKKDACAWKYYSDHARYADVVNGVIFGGKKVVTEECLHVLDSRSGKKERDLLREISLGDAMGTVGIENQDYIDYAMVQRSLIYEAGEYDRQKMLIQKEVTKEIKEKQKEATLSKGEFLGRFRKDNHLSPHAMLILYYGQEDWDSAVNLTELME